MVSRAGTSASDGERVIIVLARCCLLASDEAIPLAGKGLGIACQDESE
jgi:hypothetical protein